MDNADEPIAALETGRLDAEIGELAAHITAATARMLALVAEFDRRGAHQACGFQHCSSWLSWRCSIAPHTAREQVRVARALAELPHVSAAFSRGELSYSKVRALTRITTEANEAELVRVALEASAAQLERIVGAYRGVLRIEDEREIHHQRHLAYRWEPDGSLSFRGRLTAAEGALLLEGLEAAREIARATPEREGGPAGPPALNERQASNADALVTMAEACIASPEVSASGGDRHQLVVHVDEERAELEGGPALAIETARRLACDASVVALAESAGETVSVGRRRRTIPPSIRRALRARDRGCRFPGCGAHRFTDAHHLRHWADGGETSLGNLVLLCRRHHRLVHEGGYSIADRGGRGLVFRRPDGTEIPTCPALGRTHPGELRRLNERRRLAIEADTCLPRAGGERMDLGLMIWGLRRLEGPLGPVATRAGPDW